MKEHNTEEINEHQELLCTAVTEIRASGNKIQHLCRKLDPKSLRHTWSAKNAWVSVVMATRMSAGSLSAGGMKPESDHLQQGHL